MNGQHCFLVGNEVIHCIQLQTLYFSWYECFEYYFFIVIINGFNAQPPAPRTEIKYVREKYTQVK